MRERRSTDRSLAPAGGAVTRRALWQWPLASAAASPLGGLFAQTAAAPKDGEARLALLIGNSQYPEPYDLPSIGKNVRDMAAALDKRGFEVSQFVNLDVAKSREAIEQFLGRVKTAPDDAIVFFYFSGHGVQLAAENLLVGAGINPSPEKTPPENIQNGSLALRKDWVTRVGRSDKGLTIAVVDACRTDLFSVKKGEGLNQVEAPPGWLIAFSTGAGTPAIAPARPDENTFYTAALVNQLNTASDELSFSDVFRLTREDTNETMRNHRLAPIRKFAQDPFIAEDTRAPRVIGRRPPPPSPASAASAAAPPPPPKRFSSEDEANDWARLQSTAWPADVVKLAEEFMGRYPESRLLGGARVARRGASDALKVLAPGEIRLFRRSFDVGGVAEDQKVDLLKAARGDKDAAARVGRRLKTAATSGPELSRYEGWMQYAAELGNGIASYELALHYRQVNQPQPAARWEARSRELGYTPPPSLDQKR